MGKKKPEEMAKERAKFEDGAAKRRHRRGARPTPIFDLMEKFAGYGFNKSHAAAYALVAYQTAWLKAHYPAEFMAAMLSSDMDNTDKVVGFLDEARGHGPDRAAAGRERVGVHVRGDRTADDASGYGLGAVKGVGRGACEAIVDARARRPFADLLDFCKRVDIAASSTGARWKR